MFFYWLVPERQKQTNSIEDAVEISNYASEATVTGQSTMMGKPLAELLRLGDGEVVATAVFVAHPACLRFQTLFCVKTIR